MLSPQLGGAIVMDGFPLPPLFDLPGHPRAAAEKNLTYYGDDMAWMIWHGDADPIFPVNLTMSTCKPPLPARPPTYAYTRHRTLHQTAPHSVTLVDPMQSCCAEPRCRCAGGLTVLGADAAIFDLLGVADTVKVNHTEPGMTHTLIGPEFDAMVKFIRG